MSSVHTTKTSQNNRNTRRLVKYSPSDSSRKVRCKERSEILTLVCRSHLALNSCVVLITCTQFLMTFIDISSFFPLYSGCKMCVWSVYTCFLPPQTWWWSQTSSHCCKPRHVHCHVYCVFTVFLVFVLKSSEQYPALCVVSGNILIRKAFSTRGLFYSFNSHQLRKKVNFQNLKPN